MHLGKLHQEWPAREGALEPAGIRGYCADGTRMDDAVTDGLYLGLDASTQSLTIVVVESAGARRAVVLVRSLPYDREFRHYGTEHGVLPRTDPLVATSSPLLWADALERGVAIVAQEPGLDAGRRLRAVSGAAQQHGSVYLNARAIAGLGRLAAGLPLARQVERFLSRADAPIWMDASTGDECRAITDALGGADAVAALTGSRAIERFTGPQIRKYAARDPAGYAATDRIHLVSSFLASLLIGGHAPLEPGDAAGMNLMDLRAGRWAPRALAVTAPDLLHRLPAIVPSPSVIGTLAPYWRERYRLPAAAVVAWTGDNPSSLVGTGLVTSERCAISLGTSDTVFRLLDAPCTPAAGSHVFGAPTGGYLALTCFQNGGLARERVRDAHGLDWDGFARALRGTPPGNGGRMMLPWFEPEITPAVFATGARRFGLAPEDAAGNVRAVIEAQMLAMARHAAWMGDRLAAIHATGGGAANDEILQVMADVHAADVFRVEAGNAAALGGALRALHGAALAAGAPMDWPDVVAGIAAPAAPVARPDPGRVAIYRALRPVHAAREAEALSGR